MHAHAAGDFSTFEQHIQMDLNKSKRNTIFVDSIVQQMESRSKVLKLLDEHVKRNIVKIGKKFYRQKEGIPQGSVLSSLLCNFFYAELEKDCLTFVHNEDSVLLRLIDDFLLVSLNRQQVERFLQVMHDGLDAYGVAVKADKTLVNFDVEINGRKLKESSTAAGFPYCGVLVNPNNLSIGKDRERKSTTSRCTLQERQTYYISTDTNVEPSDSLTVDFSKLPGQTFHRKALKYGQVCSWLAYSRMLTRAGPQCTQDTAAWHVPRHFTQWVTHSAAQSLPGLLRIGFSMLSVHQESTSCKATISTSAYQ